MGDPQHVARRLEQLRNERTPLVLRVGEHPLGHPSLILRAEADTGLLLLDAVNDARGHRLVLEERELHLLAGGRGKGLAFDTRLEELVEQAGGPAYRVAWPAAVIELQRREHYRVAIPHMLGLLALLDLGDGGWSEARVRDLSTEGVGLDLPHPPPGLAAGGPAIACEIDLGEGPPLVAELEIRRIVPGSHHGPARLGARFVDLAPADRRRVERQIASLQRTLIRLTPGA